jgi:hypothetical protein
LSDTAYYDSAITYQIGRYVIENSASDEIFVYKSLQAGNIGNTPSTSPTWWEYSSTFYEAYQQGVTLGDYGSYSLGYKVYDSTTKSIWESLTENNVYPLDVTENPPWVSIGVNNSTLPVDYSSFTTYAIGDLVYHTWLNSSGVLGQDEVYTYQGVYKSLQAGNLDNFPYESPAEWELQPYYPVPWLSSMPYIAGRVVYDTSGKLWRTPYGSKSIEPAATYTNTWVRVETGNRSAMFDSYSSSQTSVNKSIKVQLTGAFATAIGFLNTNADTITVNIYTGVGGALVYTNTTGLGSAVTNAWDYYFTDPSVKRKQAYLSGLPASAAYLIEVELTGTDMVNLGHLILGTEVELGYAEYGLTSDITDFSRKVTDDFGRTTFVKRGFKRNMELQMLIPNENLTAVENRLEEVRSTPILVLASDNPYYIETVLRFCFYKTFRTEISYPTFAFVSIQFEGLI